MSNRTRHCGKGYSERAVSYLVSSSDRENLRGQCSIGQENGRSCRGVFDGRFVYVLGLENRAP